ncbi:MAG: thioredoxin family protein [Anaerolineales bacterium]|nr:thioredoxin family protein [Anaerolineales bacterium]MCX7609399.1 thioredoxin family protein [Anaerolineales bacterium]MDW8227110.1 thioredoxin family protein [Anaerolineales bacterium]
MAPIVHGLEAEYYGKIQFVYLDAGDPKTKEFQQALGFRVQPAFYLLDGEGRILKQWIGIVSAEEFREAFDQALSSQP